MSTVSAFNDNVEPATGWLNMVVASDRNYLPHMATTIASAVASSLQDISRVFVLSADLTEQDIEPLRLRVLAQGFSALTLVPVKTGLVQSFHVSQHVSHATYMRFYAAELLPEDIDHVLYLDCDTVVVDKLTDLKPHLQTLRQSNSTSNPLFAAAWRESNSPHLRPFGFRSENYFNAGVVVLNLTAFRREKLTERLVRRAEKHHGQLMWWDQDVLNLELQDRWISIESRFNVTADQEVSKPVIIHFSGSEKPWSFGCRHPERLRYREFRAMTPYVPFRRDGAGKYLYRLLVPRLWKRRKKLVTRLRRRMIRALTPMKKALTRAGGER